MKGKIERVFKQMAIVIQIVALCCAVCACTGRAQSGSENIDPTKTQLYVSAFDAGYGQEWFNVYKAEFEKLYAETSFEEGKMGVQVIPDWNQAWGQTLLASMNGSENQIYFNNVDYYDLVNSGCAMDLTDILEEELDEFGESGNVMDKIPEDMQEYLLSVNEGKLYAIPSTETWDGINYNIDLFEDEEYGGFYFASEYDAATPVFTTGLANDRPKAKGPDNLPNTYDDGLPATIEQFYQLLDRMVARGVTPFTFTATVTYFYGHL